MNELRKYACLCKELKDKASGYLESSALTNFTDEEFMLLSSYVIPQKYGPYMEKRVINELGATKIKPALKRGDCVKKGIYYEIKCSLLSRADSKINMVQIRPWHKFNYLLAVVYDTTTYNCYRFVLDKQELFKEMAACRATSAHGSVSLSKPEVNDEFRWSIGKESKHFERWKIKYMINNFKEI